MDIESVDYEVWNKLRSEVLETLNDLAYCQAFYSLDINKEKMSVKIDKHQTILARLLEIVATCMSVENGKTCQPFSDTPRYEWLHINFKKDYIDKYRTYKAQIN